jgi:hypothetical protein
VLVLDAKMTLRPGSTYRFDAVVVLPEEPKPKKPDDEDEEDDDCRLAPARMSIELVTAALRVPVVPRVVGVAAAAGSVWMNVTPPMPMRGRNEKNDVDEAFTSKP